MTVRKPIFLNSAGLFQQVANGELLNVGGTTSSSFTVGGRGLLFDDGSSTSGTLNAIDLQQVYDNSSSPATIKLTTGKDFVIIDDNDNSLYFKIDSETGAVTITGDLTVLGSSSTINTVIQDSDHWLISPSSPLVTPFKIEPDNGVVPIVDLITVRRTYGTLPVFRVDKDGNLFALNPTFTGNVTATGTINGVDLAAFYTSYTTHTTSSATPKHEASEISVTPITNAPGATDVQAALEGLSSAITTGTGGGSVSGYEHVQTTPSALWVIAHNKNTRRIQSAIYDSTSFEVWPDSVQIIDPNTIHVRFAVPQDGSAFLLCF